MTTISFCFRRISEKEKSLPFKTGEPAFDKLNDKSGTLEEYFNEDTIESGRYTTYLFTEQNQISNLVVLGLVRYKEVLKKEFYRVLDEISIDNRILSNIKKDLDDHEAKIIYLSRIGIQDSERKKRVGTLLARFFDFIMLREGQNVVIYAKVLEKLDLFLSGPYITIGSGKDAQWGDFLVKYRVIFH